MMRTAITTVSALLACACFVSTGVSPARADESKPVMIRSNYDPAYCIRAPAYSVGTQLVMEFCSAKASGMHFLLSSEGYLRPQAFGLKTPDTCIDGADAPGPLTLRQCGAPSQRWDETAQDQLQNPSGMCIDIPFGWTYPGAGLVSYTSTTAPWQRWTLVS